MPNKTERALDHYRTHAASYLEDLKTLVRIPSVSFVGFPPEPVRRSAEATAELLRRRGFTRVEILEVEGAHPYVFGESRGRPQGPHGPPLRAPRRPAGRRRGSCGPRRPFEPSRAGRPPLRPRHRRRQGRDPGARRGRRLLDPRGRRAPAQPQDRDRGGGGGRKRPPAPVHREVPRAGSTPTRWSSPTPPTSTPASPASPSRCAAWWWPRSRSGRSSRASTPACGAAPSPIR